MAQTPPGGTPAAPLESDSPARGPLHGHGRGTGERSTDSSTTRRPYAATRYLETHHGILSYAELAPLLAEHVANTEQDIAERRLTTHRFDDTLLELHRRICADLIPAMAGRWRTLNVCVGAHTPPPYWTIPAHMRDYAADLQARLSQGADTPTEQLIEDLAFAEGRLLHLHPFEDFNGRVTRLFLIELLYRLELPIIDPATDPGTPTQTYFAALRAYDRHNPNPLIKLWRQRFEQAI